MCIHSHNRVIIDSVVVMNASKDNWKTFENYIKIWSNFLSGLGMSPITFYHNEKGELLCRVSLWKIITSVYIFVTSIAIIIFQEKEYDYKTLGTTFIIGCINIISGIVLTLHGISVIWNSRSYAALITKFLKFNRCISNIQSRNSFAISLRYLICYSIVYIISLISDVYLFLWIEEPFTINLLLTYIPGLYELFSLWHFAVCCLWLREYLWIINRYIEKYSRSSLSRIEFLKVNAVYPECLEPQSEMNVNTLRYIRRLYHEVYIISQGVNSAFATRNLLLVAENFIFGTILIYCALNEFFKYRNNNSALTIFGIADYAMWSIMCFLLVYGVVGPCTRVYSEAQDTVVRVQQLFSKSSDGELQQELHSFVMQLFHEKIVFSPHGFFKLNNELLLSIIGSVASYLIVLIQFRISLSNQ